MNRIPAASPYPYHGLLPWSCDSAGSHIQQFGSFFTCVGLMLRKFHLFTSCFYSRLNIAPGTLLDARNHMNEINVGLDVSFLMYMYR